MSKKTKRYLMLLVAVGLIAVAAGGAGTFASFSAETANTGNYFAAGTLFLHNTSGATTCTSEAASASNLNVSNSNGCSTLFPNVSVKPGVTETAPLTLANAGTLNASGIKFALGSACTDAKPTIATLGTALTNAVPVPGTITLTNLNQDLLAGTQIQLHEGIHAQTLTVTAFAAAAPAGPQTVSVTSAGNANFAYTTAATVSLDAFGSGLCANLKFYVQEKDGVGGADVSCAYGSPTPATTCPANPTTTLGGVGTTPIALTLDPGRNGNTGVQLSSKKSRYFVIGVVAPSSLSNTAQNTELSFDLAWHIDQA
jgi:predicted ribosomally synthesized peptide with SipW-like signal peptide